MSGESDRYVVISTDGHCGAKPADYKPYLEAKYHDECDAWAKNFDDGWIETDLDAVDPNQRLGQASYEAPLNWESQSRLEFMEEQGIVAEVLFPNTAPPFYPSGVITAVGPRTPQEYEYRWAGLRAHNRWLADFCADTPGRRAGLVQVFLENIDDAIAEVRWAKKAGLMGVLLPSPHVLKMVNLYYPTYDPLWAVCAELGMPICTHDNWITESPKEVGTSALLAGAFEINFYSKRQIGHLIAAAVFDRFPTLKLAATELKDSSAVPAWLAGLDAIVEGTLRYADQDTFLRDSVKLLHRKPSEYFASNVYLGGPLDIVRGIAAGTPNLMFGADVPHGEGVWPFTTKVLRLALPQVSESERRKILSERQAEVYGFDLNLLKGFAAKVGPKIEEVATPLPANELPRYPEDTRCAMFRHRAA
ncbi:MAG: amidohydrolase [Rhodospirillaceae bacterium]|nr:MAG: amidohydrolase [Rhodospirillaceae bacterium]